LRFKIFFEQLYANVKGQILQSFVKANRFSNAGQFAYQIDLAQNNFKCQIKKSKKKEIILSFDI
jgi:hypothetical protein